MTTRIGLACASLVLGAMLLVNFKVPTDRVTAASSGTSGTTTGSTSGTTSGSTTGGTGTTTGATVPSGTETLTGSVVTTRYGPVQVEVSISNGKIVTVTAIELPSGGRSGAISDIVGPMLQDEALTAQSASIDIVSGATYTSRAYATSLQAALDSAA